MMPKRFGPRPRFSETFFDDGHVDMPESMQTYHRLGFEGTFIDCMPMFLGRDVYVLLTISETTGLHIITNTG